MTYQRLIFFTRGEREKDVDDAKQWTNENDYAFVQILVGKEAENRRRIWFSL